MNIADDNVDEGAEQLASLLERVTNERRAEWFRPAAAYAVVVCALENDLVTFNVFRRKGARVARVQDARLVIATCRGVRFVWTKEFSGSWGRLLALFQSSVVAVSEIERRKTVVKKRVLDLVIGPGCTHRVLKEANLQRMPTEMRDDTIGYLSSSSEAEFGRIMHESSARETVCPVCGTRAELT